MITIRLSPVGSGAALPVVSMWGETLHIDGDNIDFSTLDDGDEVSRDLASLLHPMLDGSIARNGDCISLTLALPFDPGFQPDNCVAFPDPIEITEDGPVDLPFSSYSETTETQSDGGYEVTTTIYHWRQEPEVSTVFVAEPEPEEAN